MNDFHWFYFALLFSLWDFSLDFTYKNPPLLPHWGTSKNWEMNEEKEGKIRKIDRTLSPAWLCGDMISFFFFIFFVWFCSMSFIMWFHAYQLVLPYTCDYDITKQFESHYDIVSWLVFWLLLEPAYPNRLLWPGLHICTSSYPF